jgi:lysophospholipase L1-like esterase
VWAPTTAGGTASGWSFCNRRLVLAKDPAHRDGVVIMVGINDGESSGWN